MYVFFEYMMVVALIALIASVLFAASAVVVMVEQGIAAVLRISQRTVSTGTLPRALEPRPRGVILAREYKSK
jgi:hypothetical protein